MGGGNGNRRDENPVIGFTLPDLALGDTIASVELFYNISAGRDHSGNANGYSLDAYLINDDDPSTTGITYFYHGASGDDGIANTEFLGGLNPTTTLSSSTNTPVNESVTLTLSGAALTQFIAFYGGDEIADQTEAFFRFNMSGNPPESRLDRLFVDLATTTPTLTITTVPEPSSTALLGLGGLALILRRRK